MVGANLQVPDSAFIRKLRKPLIEKKRRDRMNASIEQIKAILAKTSTNGTSIVGKDKAEILELAVSHIAKLQDPAKNGSMEMTSYMTGYRECARETMRYLSTKRSVSDFVLQDVHQHLNYACDKPMANMRTTQSPSSSFSHPESVRTSTPPLDLTSSSMSATSRRIYGRHLAMASTPQSHMLPPMMSPIETFRPISTTNEIIGIFASPGSGMSSPAFSSCSTSTFDSGICMSGTSNNSPDTSGESDSFSDNALVIDVKEDQPWRPW